MVAIATVTTMISKLKSCVFLRPSTEAEGGESKAANDEAATRGNSRLRGLEHWNLVCSAQRTTPIIKVQNRWKISGTFSSETGRSSSGVSIHVLACVHCRKDKRTVAWRGSLVKLNVKLSLYTAVADYLGRGHCVLRVTSMCDTAS